MGEVRTGAGGFPGQPFSTANTAGIEDQNEPKDLQRADLISDGHERRAREIEERTPASDHPGRPILSAQNDGS